MSIGCRRNTNSRWLVGSIWSLAAVAVMPGVSSAEAQTVAGPPGLYLEAEGQAVLGDSDFEAGMLPGFAFVGPLLKLDEGNGWGGAVAFGYAWRNGWSAAVRYRRLEADDRGGPIDPGVVVFTAGSGLPVPVFEAQTKVNSETSMFDLEVAKDVSGGGTRLQLFGGLTYTSIERDVVLSSDDCGCVPYSVHMANDFHGLGPKIGFRGGIALNNTFSLVGGGSAAALFGTSTFANRLDDPLSPPSAIKTEDDRVVAALDGHAGLAIAVGAGSLTLGYRIDAVLGALDTDQRVSPLFTGIGFPQIGDGHDDFVEHGPFARLTLPLAAGN